MFSNPETIIAALPIDPGSIVADLGAGTGAWSLVLAKKVGSAGKVYACEVQKDMLVRIENEMKECGIHNIQTVWANVEQSMGTKLRDSSIDWAVCANVLFQIEHRETFIKEIARILKPGGRLILVDWKESFGNMGPHDKDVIAADDAEKLFGNAGLRKLPIVVDGGAHHYAIVFSK